MNAFYSSNLLIWVCMWARLKWNGTQHREKKRRKISMCVTFCWLVYCLKLKLCTWSTGLLCTFCTNWNKFPEIYFAMHFSYFQFYSFSISPKWKFKTILSPNLSNSKSTYFELFFDSTAVFYFHYDHFDHFQRNSCATIFNEKSNNSTTASTEQQYWTTENSVCIADEFLSYILYALKTFLHTHTHTHFIATATCYSDSIVWTRERKNFFTLIC